MPDALILFRHFLAPQARVELEMELHAKSDARYKARFQKFQPAYQKSQAFHWYWVPSTTCGRRILEIAEEHGGHRAEEFVGFTVIPEFQAKGLEAVLTWDGQRLPLHDVFEIPRIASPAQGAAQGLSREKTQNPGPLAA